jgi:S1-C subfamily serine protease
MNRNSDSVVVGFLVALLIIGLMGSVVLPLTLHRPNQTEFTSQVQESAKGVVHIQCPRWQGSGFVIAPNIIMTARHCTKGVEEFIITTNNGHKLRATRAIYDKEHDLSFIHIDDFTCIGECDGEGYVLGEHKIKFTVLELATIDECVLGQNVYAIGSPYGKINFNAVSYGIISGVNRDWDEINPRTGESYGWEVAFTIDAAGHPGNSGCPVFTLDGKVRGILVGGFSPVLISVMPCDIFINDIESIKLMFVMNKYGFEKERVVQDAYYNYTDDNEYY